MLRTRILTALGLAIVCIAGFLYGGAPIARALLSVVVLLGALEWSAFFGGGNRLVRLCYVLLVAALCYFGQDLSTAQFRVLLLAALVWWCLTLLWIALASMRVPAPLAALAGLFVLVPTWLVLVRIDAYWVRGAQWTLFILALAFACDTGAYFAGHRFGRVKLAPSISPGKTWEGVFGGMALATVFAIGGGLWFQQPLDVFVPLCLAAAGFSIVGDLLESLLKRSSGLKDSGRIFPGHGGVLDRIDSVTAATPIIALGLLWLGVGA
ncbi:MAG: phosphatidate cytidylyltransferase [Steroidobacteraceae bacterium]|jgi:phosphatidate cytidylyltransferase